MGEAETVFIELLEHFTADGRPISDNSHAGNYAPRLFAKRPDREGFEKRDFEKAMEVPFAQRRIKIEEYGRSSDRRKRLAAVQMEEG